jgi:hypothetical protein
MHERAGPGNLLRAFPVGLVVRKDRLKGPNPLRTFRSLLRAGRRRRPDPRGEGRIDHDGLEPVLEAVAQGGIRALADVRDDLAGYRSRLHDLDPDRLEPAEALAYWINLYNAETLEVAAQTAAAGRDSILRLAGAFDRPRAAVAGETLSLDDIEHGKVRRFKDPRVHAALVCGSVSCPTLRSEPYTGCRLDDQLEDQMRKFLATGAAEIDWGAHTLRLSRIFLWYGPDFVHPSRMPRWRPVRRRSVARSLLPWLPEEAGRWLTVQRPRIAFQPYDWGLGCNVR